MNAPIENKVTPAQLEQMQVAAWDAYLKHEERMEHLLQQLSVVLKTPADGTPEQTLDRQFQTEKIATSIYLNLHHLDTAVNEFARLTDAEIRHYRKQHAARKL